MGELSAAWAGAMMMAFEDVAGGKCEGDLREGSVRCDGQEFKKRFGGEGLRVMVGGRDAQFGHPILLSYEEGMLRTFVDVSCHGLWRA